MNRPLDEVAFLANSVNRIDVLRILTDDAHSRRELVEVTNASRPTVGRVLGEFEQRNWVKRDGRLYEITPLGRMVMNAFDNVLSVMETEQNLRTAVEWIPTERIGFDLKVFTDANVSTPEPGSSHQPINRFIELAEEADSARGFGIATLAPKSAETLFQKAAAGMETEIIYPSTVLEDNLLSTPDAAREAIDNGTLHPMVHEDLPCGLYIFDDRVIIGGYNRETGVLRVVLDIDEPDALEWADTVYSRYRREAEPINSKRLWNSTGEIHSVESRESKE